MQELQQEVLELRMALEAQEDLVRPLGLRGRSSGQTADDAKELAAENFKQVRFHVKAEIKRIAALKQYMADKDAPSLLGLDEGIQTLIGIFQYFRDMEIPNFTLDASRGTFSSVKLESAASHKSARLGVWQDLLQALVAKLGEDAAKFGSHANRAINTCMGAIGRVQTTQEAMTKYSELLALLKVKVRADLQAMSPVVAKRIEDWRSKLARSFDTSLKDRLEGIVEAGRTASVLADVDPKYANLEWDKTRELELFLCAAEDPQGNQLRSLSHSDALKSGKYGTSTPTIAICTSLAYTDG